VIELARSVDDRDQHRSGDRTCSIGWRSRLRPSRWYSWPSWHRMWSNLLGRLTIETTPELSRSEWWSNLLDRLTIEIPIYR